MYSLYFIIISSTFSFLIISVIANKNMLIGNILCKIIMFSFIFIFKNKLNTIQNTYKKLWNRNDKISKKMKSTTFRALNIFIFNILFAIFNFGMLYAIYYNNIVKGGI